MVLAPNQQRKRFGRGEILQEAVPKPVSPIENCLKEIKLSWQKNGSIAALWQEWTKLAGKDLAKNCRPLSLQRGILVVGVSHPQWLQAIQYNRLQLLGTLKAKGHKVKEIRIQQYHPQDPKEQIINEQKNLWERHPSRVDIHGVASCKYCGSPCPKGEINLWGKCSFCRRKQLF